MMNTPIAERIKQRILDNPDLSFAVLLAAIVYGYFAVTNDLFMTNDTTFAIMERFAVLGLVGLALTLCIIAGEIDLSIGSNAALTAVIVVRFNDSLGTFTALAIGLAVATTIGIIQGYFVAYLRVRAIVLTVGTLMLLRGVALFAAGEKTVMLTEFDVPDFIQSKVLGVLLPGKPFGDRHVRRRGASSWPTRNTAARFTRWAAHGRKRLRRAST